MFTPSQKKSVYNSIALQKLASSAFELHESKELKILHADTGFYFRIVPVEIRFETPSPHRELRLFTYATPAKRGAMHDATQEEGGGKALKNWDEALPFLDDWLAWLKQEYDVDNADRLIDEELKSSTISKIDITTTSLLSHLHPTIQQVAASRFASAHYSDAIQKACTALEKAVQVKSGQPKTATGTSVMTTAFSKNNTLIHMADDPTEQFGFMNLYQGAVQALRNHFAHGLTELTDPARALEWLGFISALFHKLDEAQPPDTPITP